MAEKPETRFSKRLHSELFKLDPEIYVEKASNPYRRGTPDFYYESLGPVLWAEHKWINKAWTTDKLPSQICKTRSWSAQRRWLDRAHQNNKQTLVIVGIGSGKYIAAYVLEWPFSFKVSEHKALSLEEVAQLIKSKVQCTSNGSDIR